MSHLLQDVEAFKGQDGKAAAEPTEITCPKCKEAKLAIRFGKAGEFLGCLTIQNVDFTTNFKRDEQGHIELVKVPDHNCLMKHVRNAVSHYAN